MLGQISKLIKALNSEVAPQQISLAVAFAMVIGFTPFWSLHNLLVLFLVMILRVNIAAFMASIPLFALLGYFLDPLFHQLGWFLLKLDSLNGLWVMMYNTNLWRIENFSNTIVMGSLITSLILFVPVHLGLIQLINKYRNHIMARFEEFKLNYLLKIQNWFSKISSFVRLG